MRGSTKYRGLKLLLCALCAIPLVASNGQAMAAIEDDDTTPPQVAITSPTLSITKNDVEVRVSVSDTNLRHYWYQIKKENTILVERTVLSSGITNQLLATLKDEGTYTISLAARDKTGGTSTSGNRSQTVNKVVKIDKTAPYVAITSPTVKLSNGNIEVRATATDENLRHYGYRIEKDGVVIAEQTIMSSGITNQLLQTLTEDGEYTISFAARDKAGGEAYSGNRSVTITNGTAIDKLKPTVNIDNPTANLTSAAVEVRVTATDKNLQDYTYNIKKDGANFAGAAVESTGATNELVKTLDDEGIYEITLTARDKAGNEAIPVTKTVTIDKTAPVITLTQPPAATEGEDVVVEGMVDDPTITEVEMYVDGVQQGTKPITNGTFSYIVSHPASGSYSIFAKAQDAAGNEATSPVVVAVVNAVSAADSSVSNSTPAVPPSGTVDNAPVSQPASTTDTTATPPVSVSQTANSSNPASDGHALGISYPDPDVTIGNSDSGESGDSTSRERKAAAPALAVLASAESSPFLQQYWWLIIIALALAGTSLFAISRRRKKQKPAGYTLE